MVASLLVKALTGSPCRSVLIGIRAWTMTSFHCVPGCFAKPGEMTPTWTPKVCRIMAFMAIMRGLGLLFYILLGFRYTLKILNV